MTTVTLRDLRRGADDILDRVARGEQITITRAGRPVAELRPAASPALGAGELLARWRGLPAVDSRRLRADLDASFEGSLD